MICFLAILNRELLAYTRKRRYFLLRTLITAFMFFLLTFIWSGIVERGGRIREAYYTLQSGRSLFFTAVFWLVGFAFLLTPAYCSTLITSEKEKKTLGTLTILPCNMLGIVAGKLLSRVGMLLIMILGTLPVLSITLMFGGVALYEVLIATALIASTVLVTGGVSILSSVLARSSQRALVGTYAFMVIWWSLALVLGLAGITTSPYALPVSWSFVGVMPWLMMIIGAFFNPFMMTGVLMSGRMHLGPAVWAECIGTNVLFFTLCTLMAAFILSRQRERTAGTARKIGSPWSLFSRKSAGGEIKGVSRAMVRDSNPVLWKDSLVQARQRRNILRQGLRMLFYLIVLGPLLIFSVAVLHRTKLPLSEILRFPTLIGLEGLIASLLVLGTAASTFTAERASQTIEFLALTPLSNKSIVKAKMIGSIRRHFLICSLPLVHTLVCVFMRYYHPLSLFLVALAQLPCFIFAAIIGVFYSIGRKTASGALVASVLTWWGINIGMSILGIVPAALTEWKMPGALTLSPFSNIIMEGDNFVRNELPLILAILAVAISAHLFLCWLFYNAGADSFRRKALRET